MKLYVDDYFHSGQRHLGSGKPCQDYSLSGTIDDGVFAIVSDGCSTGRHTDVGARVIALSTANALQDWLKIGNIPIHQLNQFVTEQHHYALVKSGEIFNLQLQDLLATCAYGCLLPNGGLISIQGDGVIAKIYSNGSIVLTAYRWDNNIPLYPAYALNHYEDFIRVHGNDLTSQSLKVENRYRDDSGSSTIDLQSISLENAISGITQQISKDEITKLSFLAIFTDGVMQVEGMGWEDAVLELLAFKNLNGEFAKRRMIRFIKDSKAEGKKGPLDDIAYAVIRIDHEISEEV